MNRLCRLSLRLKSTRPPITPKGRFDDKTDTGIGFKTFYRDKKYYLKIRHIYF